MNRKLFHAFIFSWFSLRARILPWRNKQKYTDTGVRDETIASYFSKKWDRNPYHVIVSEMMLQQTQVDRVIPKFEAFLERFPTVQSLAAAKASDVLVMWKGLGYNRRALYLKKMAEEIVKTYDGVFPKDEESLIKLPGVGSYTARAILAFAYGKDVGVIDTNIKRIFARTYFGVEFQHLPVSYKEFERVIDEAVPKGKGDPWNQALMDFGATVCTAKRPQCERCPVHTLCKANARAVGSEHPTYAVLLKEEDGKKIKPKKQKVPFKQTDRYFRGKIVDTLRDGDIHMKDLYEKIQKEHGLKDRKRWGVIIEQLMVDGLIQIKGSIVSLP